jgi:hypothetical protein
MNELTTSTDTRHGLPAVAVLDQTSHACQLDERMATVLGIAPVQAIGKRFPLLPPRCCAQCGVGSDNPNRRWRVNRDEDARTTGT